MTLQAGPPPSMSVSQINTELGLAATTSKNLGDADMRTLSGIATGAIDMASFYGKTRRVVINYTVASNVADGNMRNAAIAAGWDQVTPIDLTVTNNANLYASSTGVYALLSGTFPALSIVKLVNNGGILGCGGAGGGGGQGAWLSANLGAAGAAAGPGFCAQQAVTVTNNAWIASGGGGGGGGGSGLQLYNPYWGDPAGGGGGGGRGNGAGGAGNSSVYGTSYAIAWVSSAAGGAGSLGAPGAGGAGIVSAFGTSGNGGAGGDVGGAGAAGTASACNWSNATGGAGGSNNNAIVNNGYITWVTVGARYGGIV